MNVHISYKTGKTPEIEREFHHQIDKLRLRLHVYKPDLVHLHAILGHENGHSVSASLNLRLPTGQMTAQESGESMLAVVKAAFAELLSQVTRHKELLRGQWSWKNRRSPGSRQASAPAPPLEQGVTALPREAPPLPELARIHVQSKDGLNDGLDVCGWFSANLDRLEKFAERELRYRVATGQIREDQVTPDEVIDEVMVSALSHDESLGSHPADSHREERPDGTSSESWFYRLALRAIRRLVQANADTANVSLDAPAGRQNVTGSDENVLQYHQPDDSLPEESTIPDQDAKTPEEIASDDEFMFQLDLVLRNLKPEDREAFVLYTLEGFTVEEIARIAGRPLDQVRESIAHARQKVQRKFPWHDEFKRGRLRQSQVA